MVQAGYNPQEVLSPLMQRFGRSLRCSRAEGFGRMVTAVSEALEVNRTTARRLVQSLASGGLIDFECASSAGRYGEREPVPGGAPTSGGPSSADSRAGIWRIGPSA